MRLAAAVDGIENYKDRKKTIKCEIFRTLPVGFINGFSYRFHIFGSRAPGRFFRFAPFRLKPIRAFAKADYGEHVGNARIRARPASGFHHLYRT